MDTILDNSPGENYFDTHALADFVSVCYHRCQHVAATGPSNTAAPTKQIFDYKSLAFHAFVSFFHHTYLGRHLSPSRVPQGPPIR